MARWKWHLGGERDRVDPVGPATLYGGQCGVPDCRPRPAWAIEPTGGYPAAGALTPEQACRGDAARQRGIGGQVMNWSRAPVPDGPDIERPAAARVYDGLLGGARTFAADRRMAGELLAASPEAAYWAWANRQFLGRAVRFTLAAGVRQVLDIGCGLPPTVGSVHEIAWSVAPDTRVAYVDSDPTVVAGTAAMLRGRSGAAAVCADVRDPGMIVDHPEVAAVLDWSRPVVVLLVAVLHFVSDQDDPAALLTRLHAAVAPGSYLVISHASRPPDMTARQQEAAAAYSERTARLTLRSPAQIEALFAGWRLVTPGVVQPAHWQPDPGELDDADRAARAERIPGWAGVAVKDAGPHGHQTRGRAGAGIDLGVG
jgi:SAM-dependent methyltransferase